MTCMLLAVSTLMDRGAVSGLVFLVFGTQPAGELPEPMGSSSGPWLCKGNVAALGSSALRGRRSFKY